MKQQFEIKISGSGTVPQILSALRSVIKTIEEGEQIGALNGATYEDPTLITELNEL